MANLYLFRQLLASLNTQTNNESQTLENITVQWGGLRGLDLTDSLKDNNLFPALAKAMESNLEVWKNNFPKWVYTLLQRASEYDAETIFPQSSTRALAIAFRKYILNGAWGCVDSLRCLAGFPAAQPIFVKDYELYHTLKNEIHREGVVAFFSNSASGGFFPWQIKIIEDQKLISTLLQIADTNTRAWDVIANISQHPDAKTLLPIKEIIEKANKSNYVRCTDICTLLCSDADLSTLKLSSTWIDSQTTLLNSFIQREYAVRGDISYSLLAIVMPISNISVVDSYKEELGRKALTGLLQIVLEKEKFPNVLNIQGIRQEVTKAIWNLAYVESNCELIKKSNRLEELKREHEQTEDKIIKKNIEGILHMCKSFVETPVPIEPSKSEELKGKHVMISYNWANQPIVKKIAQSLKEHGYQVWLDIERMGGSTLEAMAGAVEQAELVLICMSQKYKDSPNCRLEGEYCVNRKIAFVPLMMQSGYQPDGWLGITLGAKLWYDFSDDSNWNTKIASLIKAIGERGKSGSNTTSSTPLPALPPVSSPPPSDKKEKVMDWTLEDMQKWMQENRIENHFEIFKKHKIDGIALLELQHFLHSSSSQPSFFFKYISKQMGIEEIGEIMRLSAAIRKL